MKANVDVKVDLSLRADRDAADDYIAGDIIMFIRIHPRIHPRLILGADNSFLVYPFVELLPNGRIV